MTPPIGKIVKSEPKRAHDEDALYKSRDLIFAVGFGLLVAGVAILSIPAAYIVAGAGLMAFGWLLSRSKSE